MRIRRKKHLEERLENVKDILIVPEKDIVNVKIAIENKAYFDFFSIFGNYNPVELEIGCGKGSFIVQKAVKNPNKNYLAVEMLENIIVMACECAKQNNLKNILFIGLPAMLEQLLMRAGMVIFAKTVADLGTSAYATHQVCMNIQALSFMTGQAFAVSATSLVGQSLGKRRADMAQAYCGRTRTIGFAFAIFLAIIFVFFGGDIVGLYNSDPEIIRIGGQIMLFI